VRGRENEWPDAQYGVSQCLWAKTFREDAAADIALMQGHDCCNYRYVMES
jgi:hypothetical protein